MGIPCTRCVSHTGYLAHGNNKGKIKGSRHQDNSKRVRNRDERNVGTKGKSPKQGLTSAKVSTLKKDPQRRHTQTTQHKNNKYNKITRATTYPAQHKYASTFIYNLTLHGPKLVSKRISLNTIQVNNTNNLHKNKSQQHIVKFTTTVE